MPILRAIAACVLLFAAMNPATARDSSPSPPSPKAALERLFTQPVEAGWFAPVFLDQVSAGQVATIVAGLTDQYGALRDITGAGDSFVVGLARADIPARIALDDEGRIRTLLFRPAIASGATLKDYLAAITALPGRTSVLVTTGGETVAAHEPDAVLAVGSAIKLAILAALNDAVADRRLAWDQVVALKPAWRSLPTSTLIDWPDGSPVTVATLRNLMISASDNMATDALIDLVGRTPIEALAPRNTPFATTAELFKLQADRDQRSLWNKADTPGRREILAHLDQQPLPALADLPEDPGSAEWFATARELCALLERVAGSPAFTINPGPAERADWQSVAFKGGSDSGVLNLSTRVVGKDGTPHCVVATWNNPGGAAPLDRLMPIYRGMLASLRSAATLE